MDRDDVMIPDFSSVLSGGDEPNYEVHSQTVGDETETGGPQYSIKIKDIMEHQQFERESEEGLFDGSQVGTPSQRVPLPGPDSSSGSETEDFESEIESELSESESESESESDSEEDTSDDDSSTSSYESVRATRELEVGECDSEECDAEHVYEEADEDEDEDEEEEGDNEVCYEDTDFGGEEEEEEEDNEVCYEATDFGGENVDTASMIAASILAGGGVVRSGTGWTWTSIFIVISAAGGIGIVLLYAIKRINELTRLVKTLEENSHMAINERDVQVITTQVIGDMLDDSDNSRGTNIETPDEVQTEFDNFERVNMQQSVSELLQEDDSDESDNIEDCAEESISNATADAKKEDNVAQVERVVSDKKEEVGEENATLVAAPNEPLANVEKKHGRNVDASTEIEKPSVAVEEKQGMPTIDEPVEMVQETGKDEPDSVVEDLATMVETMSLSEDLAETKEPSRLITGTKRVRSA